MAKETVFLQNFIGLYAAADDQGVNINSPIYSENIDPIAPQGRLQGFPLHTTSGLTANAYAHDAVILANGKICYCAGTTFYELDSVGDTTPVSRTGGYGLRGTMVASRNEVFFSDGTNAYVYTNVTAPSEYFGDTTPPSGGWQIVDQAVSTYNAINFTSVTSPAASTDLPAGEYFFAASVLHQNGSESDLHIPLVQETCAAGDKILYTVEVDYVGNFDGDSRVEFLCVYMAYNPTSGATTPATAFRRVATIDVTIADWTIGNDLVVGSGSDYEITEFGGGITYESSADQAENAVGNTLAYTAAANLYSRMAVANGSQVYFSRPLQYGVFDLDRDYVDLPTDVRKMIAHQGKLYAFMEGGTAIININGPEPFLEEIMEGVGIHSECMPISTDYGLFHCSNDQLYMNLRPIGYPVINGVTGDYGTIDWKTATKTKPFVAFDYHRGCALFFTGDDTVSDTANEVFVYSVKDEQWYYWKMPGALYFVYGSDDDIYLFGADATDDNIRHLFNSSSLANIKWESREIDMGEPDCLKWFYEWRYDTSGGTWTASRVKNIGTGVEYSEGYGNGPAGGVARLCTAVKLKITSSGNAGYLSYAAISLRRPPTPRLSL